MFFTRKKNIIESTLLSGLTDHHTHILPNVDDGVQCVEDALKILEWYEQLGVKSITMTPHIMEDFSLNNAKYLRERFEEFKGQYRGAIELRLGAEYMLDSHFRDHLNSGDMLTIADGTILVETSYIAEPIDLEGQLKEIMAKGYFVVLAHPERYLYLTMKNYQRLKEIGVYLQLNIPSVLGGYSESVKQRAEQLLKLNIYSFIGSDIHSFAHHSRLYSERKISKSIITQMKNICIK